MQPKFVKKFGYLPSGSEHSTLQPAEMSVKAASELCGKTEGCKGYTFNSDAKKDHDDSQVATMYFKTDASKASPAEGWFT